MEELNDWQIRKKFSATLITEKLLVAATVLVVLLFSAFLISKSLSVNFEQYQQERDRIVELRELDSTFNQEILKSRYKLFADYDLLVRSLAKQKNMNKQLQNLPDFVTPQERQEMEPILKEIRTVVNNRESLSERFKSRNALLKNSLRYLPLLTSQLEEKFEVQEQAKILTPNQIYSLKSTLNGLIRNLLLYNIAVDERLTLNIEALIGRLSQLDIQYELTEEQFPTELVKSHANIILATKPQVEQLTTQLLKPLQQYTKSLEVTLNSSYKQAARRVNLYRLFTFIWFLILLIFVNYLLLKGLGKLNPALSRYKKQVKKLTAVLAEMSQTKNASSDTEGISTLMHGSSNNLPVEISSSPGVSPASLIPSLSLSNSKSELVDLADRSDELGQLARRVQEMLVEIVESKQTGAEEQALASLTASLTLVTKDRKKMISLRTVDSLKTIFSNALDEWDCQMIDFQGSLEQVQILFNYPPQVQLIQLVAHLKAVSSSYLDRNLRDIIGSLNGKSQIWSGFYSLTSCEAASRMTTDNPQLTEE